MKRLPKLIQHQCAEATDSCRIQNRFTDKLNSFSMTMIDLQEACSKDMTTLNRYRCFTCLFCMDRSIRIDLNQLRFRRTPQDFTILYYITETVTHNRPQPRRLTWAIHLPWSINLNCSRFRSANMFDIIQDH
ncbi:hypothetical protein D3C76_1210530 [compost metagenome]